MGRPQAQPARVLVITADGELASTCSAALEQWGLCSIETEDAQQALFLAAELRPAAVVVDLALPGIDVLDLAAALRAHERTRAAAIVALCRHRTRDVEALARARGCDAILGVPIPEHALGATLVVEIDARELTARTPEARPRLDAAAGDR